MAIPSLRVDAPTLTGQSILVVDDEPGVRDVLSTYLDRNGFRVSEAESGKEALRKLQSDDPDLVILDVSLPEVDGFSVLSEVRKHSDIPVILLTARAEESDRILGLELGADDYVLKPFSPRELMARVKNLLKRLHQAGPEQANKLAFGQVVLDSSTHEVRRGGDLVDLTPKEFELIEYLAHNPRQVFSREQLLHQVWDSSSEWQDPATVTVHVRRLRQKLEADPSEPRHILTVWGVGYRFEP